MTPHTAGDLLKLADKIESTPIGPFSILLGMNDDLHFKEVVAARASIASALRHSASSTAGGEVDAAGPRAEKEDNTCYIERSKVREILITSNANNETTRELLADVDALTIFVASDFAAPQSEVQSAAPVAWIVKWATVHTPKNVSAYLNEADANRVAKNVAMYAHASDVVVIPTFAAPQAAPVAQAPIEPLTPEEISALERLAKTVSEDSAYYALRRALSIATPTPPFDVGYIAGIILAGILDDWENGAYSNETNESAKRLSSALAERICAFKASPVPSAHRGGET